MLWAALALCAAACARDLAPPPRPDPPQLPLLLIEANPDDLLTAAPSPPPPTDPGWEAGCAGGGAAGGAHVRLDGRALRSLPPLCAPHATHLSAEDNWLEALGAGALRGAPALRVLRLARNHLAHVPAAALAATPHLQALDLSGNLVAQLPDAALPPLPALHTLVLRRNRLAAVSVRAFINTPNLRTLRLEENLLTEIPSAILLLPLLEDLSVAYNCVEEVSGAALSVARLARLDAAHNPLSRLRTTALAHLPHLTTLILSEASGLRRLPAAGAPRLRVLRAARAGLVAVAPALCERAPQLRALDLKYNLLETVPDLHECSELRVLELSYNRILAVEGGALAGLARLHDLLLAGNLLRRLPAAALAPAPRLQLLDLEDNQLEHIDAEAFTPLHHLEELNVGNNRLQALPAAGLARVRRLRAHNNAPLRHFPPPHMLPNVETLVLSYAYHCCEFLALMEEGAAEEEEEDEEEGGLSDLVLLPPPNADLAAWANATSLPHHYLNASTARLLSALSAPRFPRPPRAPRRVRCVPQPGPFLPCVDLFDWWTLRCGVWAVFLLALLGNGTVVFVLVSSRTRMDVPRFLVANLAAADLLMGVYLGFLAVVDAGTLGEFRAHAVAWQLSAACRTAGFLGVLSSEVSVFTLAVITLERNYAITHAMHLNKRLSLRHAGAVMAAGWGAATAAAALPLLGISDYRKFAVCLPFETETPAALAYVVTLLTVNGLAFLVLLGCYLKMYCAIRGSQAWNSNDSRIAKRMALLVFTDFLCWSPIAFFALTAAFGIELVSLEQAKVFTVFVLPLNSCCNPFLYAILTKQFKKDCALVCKAIEESRVTRGIGRCRHSSNFSNRQTPANTNSLAERSSRGGHGAGCACRRLLQPAPAPRRLRAWLRRLARPAPAPAPAPRPPAPAPARAGSVSSSVEFSSSRSDSWRTYGRPPPPPRRAASWLVARKTSQDSNLSSSRNDSSGSNATASTGTWRTSRSGGSRPRLTRQPAVLADEPPSPPAPPAGAPVPAAPPALHPPARHLHTIPSAAEPDAPLDDE